MTSDLRTLYAELSKVISLPAGCRRIAIVLDVETGVTIETVQPARVGSGEAVVQRWKLTPDDSPPEAHGP